MHYFDRRGVTRVYQTTFEKGGRTILGQWDLDEDGSWKSDLRITYRRSR